MFCLQYLDAMVLYGMYKLCPMVAIVLGVQGIRPTTLVLQYCLTYMSCAPELLLYLQDMVLDVVSWCSGTVGHIQLCQRFAIFIVRSGTICLMQWSYLE